VALMVNLVVRTLESIVSLGFFKFLCFGAYFHYFLHVYKCNFNILVCKYLEMMYESIVQFYWMLKKACGRSDNGEK